MKKFSVYLCDLTYDTIILVSDTIPINIGFIGSYMKKMFGDQIDLSLFKYPNDVIEAIKKNPPDMICLSNYSWNSNLSEYVASIAKKFNSNVVTTQGGTNFPHQSILQKKFLSNRLNTDIYTILEGEKSCSNVVQRILENDKDRKISPFAAISEKIDFIQNTILANYSILINQVCNDQEMETC